MLSVSPSLDVKSGWFLCFCFFIFSGVGAGARQTTQNLSEAIHPSRVASGLCTMWGCRGRRGRLQFIFPRDPDQIARAFYWISWGSWEHLDVPESDTQSFGESVTEGSLKLSDFSLVVSSWGTLQRMNSSTMLRRFLTLSRSCC